MGMAGKIPVFPLPARSCIPVTAYYNKVKQPRPFRDLRQSITEAAMKIGLVIPCQLMEDIERYIHSEFFNIEILPFPYDMIPDIPGVIEGRQSQADAFLFLGETARRWAAREIHPAVPWITIPRSSASILRLLFRAAREGFRMRIASDFQQARFFQRAFYEAGLSPEDASLRTVTPYPYTPDLPERNAAEMEGLLQSGAADFGITVFYKTALLLRAKGLPVYMLRPAFEDIRHAVEELIISCRLAESRQNQIAVVALHIDPAADDTLSDYDLALEQLQAARYIYECARRLQAACTELSSREYLLFTTRQPVEQETGGFRSFRLLSAIEEGSGLTLSAGIGYGMTAEEAKSRARKAMIRAMAAGGGRAFFLGEQGGLIGPIGAPAAGTVREDALLALSRRSGVSLSHLTRLQKLCRDQGSRFTPAELADASGITLRTMNRILLKLMDCGACRETGRRFSHKSGRPSRVVELYLEK